MGAPHLATWVRARTSQLILLGVALMLLATSFRITIRDDGISYYSYLPAVVVGRTFNLQPTFDRFLAAEVPVYRPSLHRPPLPNGLAADYKQVGSATLALPMYVVAQLAQAVTPENEDPALSTLSQFAFTAASFFCAALALLLMYRFVSELWGSWSARLAVACVLFATPLVAYVFLESSYSHTFSTAAVTLFAIYLYRTGFRRSLQQWFLLGVVGGLMTITHVQEIIFLALVPAEALWVLRRRAWSVRLLPAYGVFGIGLLAGVFPQIVTDRVIFERWLPQSAPNISFDFLHPHLLDMLFSTLHGWWSWSPLVVVALLGLPLAIRRLGWFAAALLGICALDVYLNAALSDWWGGSAFGARRLTDQSLLLAIGFGGIFSWLRTYGRVSVARAIAVAGITWNLLLLANWLYITHDAGPPWVDFLVGQLRAISYLPRLFYQGFVVRGLVAGDWFASLGIWLLLVLILAGAYWSGRTLFPVGNNGREPWPSSFLPTPS